MAASESCPRGLALLTVRLITRVRPTATTPNKLVKRPSALNSLRSAFKSKRKDTKFVNVEFLPAAGSGEPEVDAGGMDCRDVLDEPCMSTFRPVVRGVLPFERGMEAFFRTGWRWR